MKRFLLVLLLALLPACSQVDKMRSPWDLAQGFCWKSIQDPDQWNALVNTPQRKCGAYLLCMQVGIYTTDGLAACRQIGSVL